MRVPRGEKSPRYVEKAPSGYPTQDLKPLNHTQMSNMRNNILVLYAIHQSGK